MLGTRDQAQKIVITVFPLHRDQVDSYYSIAPLLQSDTVPFRLITVLEMVQTSGTVLAA